ncbi:Cytochrome P450 [Sergentomyia squamirostris]
MWEVYIFLVFFAIYFYFRWHLSYFDRRGISGPKALPIVGNLWEYVTGKKHFGHVYDEIYRAYPKANYVGFFKLHNPAVIAIDLDVVKNVLASDFSSFHDNDFILDPKLDPLAVTNPFFASGDEWKILRNQVSPLFSHAKVKACFPIMEAVGKNLVQYLENGPEVKNSEGIEAKGLGERFTIDAVASCAFGVEGLCFTDQKSPFREMLNEVISPSSSTALKSFISLFMPKLATILGFPFFPKHIDAWIRSFVDQVVKRRTELGEKRQDFLQNFLDLQKNRESTLRSEDIVAGQALVFMTEGTETSSSLIGFALYQLARNPDIMQTAQEEIDSVYERHGGKMTEDGILELEYLERVLFETLRMHSPVFSMARIATKSFTFGPQYPDSKNEMTIPKGTTVIVPVNAIHYDPNIYPVPHTFDPSRFTEEAKKGRHRYSFLGFGEGPRICLGQKFALFQVRAALSAILRHFDVKLSSKTHDPLRVSKKTFMLAAEDGIWVKFSKRSTVN